ncbi:tetratricopeptide repeat protein [Arcticibacter eurypsychrophilus]|uniref:tetratricopeptide repeat protein n=1 Tax=Arcticibacter eurypsychrophilus TaxID=1434752 RepID=UPI00084DDE57|nr:tetratricopeptide repeat protein [Arcticibacter eurypsychrophilus]
MIKNLLTLALVGTLIANGLVKAAGQDSVRVTSNVKRVGPIYFDASPPVDSALLRRQAINRRLRKKADETADLIKYQNVLMLHSLLNRTEISQEPQENMLTTLKFLLEDYKLSSDDKSQALILNTYGVYYGKKGNIPQAIYYFNEALRLKEKVNDKQGMASISSNLAALYQISGEYQKALVQNKSVIQLFTALRKPALVADAYLELAENQLLLNKYDEAEYNIIKKALPGFTRLGNKAGRMKCFQSLSVLYYSQKRYSEAKWFCIQTHGLAEKLNDKQALIGSLIHMAEVKNALEDHQDALRDYKKAESLAIQNQYPIKLVEIIGDMGETYNKLGNYTAAGSALDEYSRLRANLIKGMTL